MVFCRWCGETQVCAFYFFPHILLHLHGVGCLLHTIHLHAIVVRWNLTIPATLGTYKSGWIRERWLGLRKTSLYHSHTLMTILYQNPLVALASQRLGLVRLHCSVGVQCQATSFIMRICHASGIVSMNIIISSVCVPPL